MRNFFFSVALGIVSAYVLFLVYNPKPQPQIEYVDRNITTIVEVYPKHLLLSFTLEDLEADLARNYSYISPKQRLSILEAILTTSEQYHIDPLILYSICVVESSFRWWLVHEKVSVLDQNNKRVDTHAIGLGGIIYEIWADKLKAANIVQTRSDLYIPENNIKAIGLIYSEYRSLPLKPGSTHPNQSALIRYFGGNYQSYFKKIDDVIVQLFREKFYAKAPQ